MRDYKANKLKTENEEEDDKKRQIQTDTDSRPKSTIVRMRFRKFNNISQPFYSKPRSGLLQIYDTRVSFNWFI